MRRIWTAATLTLATFALTKAADAQAMAPGRPGAKPPAYKADPVKVAKMEAVLAEWAARSAEVKTLDAKFERVDEKKEWNIKTTYRGRALLQSPVEKDKEAGKACINVEKIVPPNKKGVDTEFYERIVCTGREVYHYNASTSQIFVYPLNQADLGHALEEGPLPFLFDMKVAEAKRRYHMTYIGEDAVHFDVSILPRQAIDRENFTEAKILLNKKTYLPDSLVLHHPNGKETESYFFTSIDRNKALPASNFAGGSANWGKAWKVVKANAQPIEGELRPADPAVQPAAREAVKKKTRR